VTGAMQYLITGKAPGLTFECYFEIKRADGPSRRVDSAQIDEAAPSARNGSRKALKSS
jgi:hypothetical protein